MSNSSLLDVIIVGGGASGLATATGLARQLWTAVVFTNETFRNARASHMHNFPTWDHQPPSAFRAKAKADLLARYDTIQFENADIKTVRTTEDGYFQATDAEGRSWTARKLVLAHGSEDKLPDIPGFADCWAYGIYGCLFCDGYEARGLSPSSGVLCVGPHSGIPPIALHLSRQARRLTDKVTLYTNGNADLAGKLEELLKQDKDAISGRIHVVDRKIAKFERGTGHKSQVVIHFEDGDTVEEGFIAHQPLSQAKGPFAQQLGLELTPTGDIATTPPFGETTVPGVFAVGDCATQLKAVAQAVAMGTMAAGGLVFQLGADLAKVE
ncbi:thioredoxin reductase-like protein 1 [Colletotrichum musicola]|uniref:Thioredoxin reductase-like protein 1 n=1 Tax=Colletotrichum musicola TaxID=2175873 RepID=A0A8H6N1Z2_9PEZI|nr:thioredoxin reductase-like protein 1 [Colletotrichum musicola]